MGPEPLVSVTIIFFNAERFLADAVESVLAQTYGNWELMLVDDGSADRSTELALGYARTYPGKVRYLEHDGHRNQGMSASRNLGIRHSKGEYIGLLDADDVWLPYVLEQQVAIMKSYPEAAMVCSPVQWWHSWNPEDIKPDSFQDLGVGGEALLMPPGLLAFFLQDERVVPGICSVLVRRKSLEQTGGFENAFRGMYEDQVFYAKICLEAPVFVANVCWSKVRLRGDSCTAVAARTGQYHPARRAFLRWLETYLVSEGIQDGEIWRILKRELWRYRHSNLLTLVQWGRSRVVHIEGVLKSLARRAFPGPVYRWLRRTRRRHAA